MLGSDFPFDMGSSIPRSAIEAQPGLGSAERERVYQGTAAEFLRLVPTSQ
jgi:hypothetical protein